jgi:hypothetical protein
MRACITVVERGAAIRIQSERGVGLAHRFLMAAALAQQGREVATPRELRRPCRHRGLVRDDGFCRATLPREYIREFNRTNFQVNSHEFAPFRYND